MRRLHRVRTLLALLLGTLLALLALEGALWILSLFFTRPERGAQGAGAVSVLCVGDSNTYGIGLAAADSYPGQLQAFLAQAGQGIAVVNQGYPGQNSAQVRSGLAESLARLDPAAVVALAGVNDRWSDAEAHVWTGEEPGPFARLLAHSRVAKLVRILATSRDSESATAVTAERLGGEGIAAADPDAMLDRGSEATRASVRANLESMADQCAARGIPLVLATYPVFTNEIHDDVNGTIRAVAAERGLAVADLEARFHELVGLLGRDYLYLPHDTHLSAVGNHEAARQVLLALERAGVARAEPPPPPLEERYGGLALELLPDGRRIGVDATGPPGWRFRLCLDGVYAARDGGAQRARVELDAAGITPEELPSWRGRFDASGSASTEVRLPERPAHERWRGWEVVAVAADPEGGPHAVRFSPAVPLPAGD